MEGNEPDATQPDATQPGVEALAAAAVAVAVERVAVAAPGPALAQTLGTLDHSLLDDDQALTVTAAWMRLQGWVEAGQVRGFATFADRRARIDPDAPVALGAERMTLIGGAGTPEVEEFAAAEAGAVLGIGTGAARARIADAVDLLHRLPATFAALRLGHVDGSKARLVARGTRWLSAADAGMVDVDVADRLRRWTWRRCDREVTAAAIAADPVGAERRRVEAGAAREVLVGESRDGVREVQARLDAGPATRLDARVDQVAGWLGELGDTDPKRVRCATALGVLADPDEVLRLWERLCEARRRSDIDVDMDVHVDVTDGAADEAGAEATVEADDTRAPQQPGEDSPTGGRTTGRRVGERPVPATVLHLHLRRDDAGAERWEQDAREGRCPLTAAEAHDLLGTSHVTLRPVLDLAAVPRSEGYQPSDALREATRLACPHDVFPFADTPAERCDDDHDVPWPLGFTELANLGPKSRHHHRVKTHGRWRMDVIAPGVRGWTTPTGRGILVDPDGSWHHPHARRNPPQRT